MTRTTTTPVHPTPVPSDPKAQARRLRSALAEDGITLGHSRALELVARLNGARDWNTLAAAGNDRSAAPARPQAPFGVGDAVTGRFNGKPARGRVIGLAETIKPDLWRATIAFDPPVDVVTSELFSSERRRITMVVGADGRSRRLTGTETGVMALARA
ncbi:glyoxalase superfamily protein [Aquibium sp. A9E412]|uniref:glyoxalase superfamily protein n=1 Tax=Aquibium sp. A9E412 TaxID=2976767 RepID=UPI0025AF5585|nr:glyoxalase superfamily protein [Aquibium sp. A9E412]MDN2567411.1 glyoxalase superfamily protein [Aquibium sp. A9E412]